MGHYERLARENPEIWQILEVVASASSWPTPVNMGNPRIEAATRSAQLNNNRGASHWAANLTDESNAEVAKALRSGQFANVPESWISERVRDIVKRSEVNGEATLTYAEAGRILADTTNRQQAGYITRLLEGDGDISLNGWTDNEALERRIQDARRGGPQDRAAAMEAVAGQAAQLQAAQAYSAAQADLQRLYRTGRAGVIAANRPALKPSWRLSSESALSSGANAPTLQATREVEGQDSSLMERYHQKDVRGVFNSIHPWNNDATYRDYLGMYSGKLPGKQSSVSEQAKARREELEDPLPEKLSV